MQIRFPVSKKAPCLSSLPKAVLLAFYLHPTPRIRSSKTSPSLHLSVLPLSPLLTAYIPPKKLSFNLFTMEGMFCQPASQPGLPRVTKKTTSSQKLCWDLSEIPIHGDRFLHKVSLSADCHFLIERKPALVKNNLDTAAPRTAWAKFISPHCKHQTARH